MKRRESIKLLGMLGAAGLLSPHNLFTIQREKMLLRTIHSTGEKIPVVGLGTWIQFDVGNSENELNPLREVLSKMIEYGGKVIDSSPMYGKSEEVIGILTSEMKNADEFFYATKVWTSGEQAGIKQMQNSMERMKRKKIDLMQIHNIVDWKTHIKTMRKWKEEGKIKYIGITHYQESMHDDLEEIIKSEKLDFVQFNYSIRVRNAERSLLNTALDKGVAVIINEPFDKASLFKLTKGKQLPGWASDYDINSWAQFFLKYIISHPAVTCVIPGTSNPKHVVDNMQAGYGKMPDENVRKKMVSLL